MIIDLFAGGGGASEGIRMALGRDPDVAINHDPEAVAMHTANHPGSVHYCGDVWDANPLQVTEGSPVELLWLSPDCTHFSKAKGAKPLSAKRRSLAGVAIEWARDVRPEVIALENVEEFTTWGPLGDDDRPIKERKGEDFRAWVEALRALGYSVDWRELRACDYGAPTSRKRLFVVARADGKPVRWPDATHGRGLRPYRTAAECIDWSLPVPSIFERTKPLAEKTLARIARGVDRFVLKVPRPFVVPTAHAGDFRVHSIDDPLRTITASRRGDHALVVPTLIQTGYGERPGQAPRSLVTAHLVGTHTREVSALLARFGFGPNLVRINGTEYVIVDLGMRMLAPRELYRAQSFDDAYVIDPLVNGKPITKTASIRMCGNSAPPVLVAAVVGANVSRTVRRAE